MRTSLIIALPTALLLTGCINTGADMAPESDKFAAVNFQAQVLDPAPAEGAPEMDAAMSATAIARYRQGKTKIAKDDSEETVALVLPPGL